MRSDRPWRGAPYQASEFLLPPGTPLSLPPCWNMDRSNLRQPSPSFIIFSLYPALEEALKSVRQQSYWTIKRRRGYLQKHKGEIITDYSCFQASLGISRVTLDSYPLVNAWGVCGALTKKEREREEREWESEDVLIKGNSEGLNQIILHNLVREDTAFDTEKMEMTCPQRPIPVVWNQSVAARAIHFNRGNDELSCWESGVFMCRTVCGPVQRMTLVAQTG